MLFVVKVGDVLGGKQVSYWAIMVHIRHIKSLDWDDGRKNHKKENIGKNCQNLVTEGY